MSKKYFISGCFVAKLLAMTMLAMTVLAMMPLAMMGQNPPAGYSKDIRRVDQVALKVDSGLHVPAGINATLGTKQYKGAGALYFDSLRRKLMVYDSVFFNVAIDSVYVRTGTDSVFVKLYGNEQFAFLKTAGAGIYVDTVYARSDSLFYKKNAVEFFVRKFTDSESVQDVMGAMVNESLKYVDSIPLLSINNRDFGDITTSNEGRDWVIDNNVVTYAKMQNITATNRILGRKESTGDPEELTGTQVTSMLDLFTATTKGLVPASGGGATNFLNADGVWTGGVSPTDTANKWVGSIYRIPGIDSFYYKVGNTVFAIKDSTGACASNGLKSGGNITYSGSGFKYYISPVSVVFNCTLFELAKDSITFTAPDGTFCRVDRIVATDTGFVLLTGIPAAEPVPIELGTNQTLIYQILICPGDTGGEDVTGDLIYDENVGQVVEYNTQVFGSNINPNNTTEHSSGAKSIAFADAMAGNWITLTTPQVSVAGVNTLYMKVKFQTFGHQYGNFPNGFTVWFTNKYTLASYLAGDYRISDAVLITHNVYGLDTTYNDWQRIIIPMSDFHLPQDSIDIMYIMPTATDTLYPGATFYLDEINFQGGVEQPTEGGGSNNSFGKVRTDDNNIILSTQPNDLFDIKGTGGITTNSTGKIVNIDGSLKLNISDSTALNHYATQYDISEFLTTNFYNSNGTFTNNRIADMGASTVLTFSRSGTEVSYLELAPAYHDSYVEYGTSGRFSEVVHQVGATDANVFSNIHAQTFTGIAGVVARGIGEVEIYAKLNTGSLKSEMFIRQDSILLQPYFGALNIDSLRAGTSTDSVMVWDKATGRVGYRDAALFGGGGGDMFLADVQSVTGLKTFDKDKLAMKGTSTGVTTISTANTSATSYTATLQAASGTIAYLSDITGGGHVIQEEGTPLTARANLNFIGSYMTASDNAGNSATDVTVSVPDAVADGSTKGVASFTAADFNSSSGNISIDYTNGQAASGSVKGFLTSADWTTFNNKISATDRRVAFQTAIGTDAPITATAGTAYHLPAATLTVSRAIDMTNVNTNGDYVEFYNNEEGFVWTFTGQTVYDSDGVTAVTELLINTNSVVRRINGKLMISKL